MALVNASLKETMAQINQFCKIGHNRYVKNIQGMSAYFRTGHSTPELSRTAARHGVMVHVTI
jgi:hypothetical protein